MTGKPDDAARAAVRSFAKELERTYSEGLRGIVHDAAGAAMVGVLNDMSPADASDGEVQKVFTDYLDTSDAHLRNEAVRAGICAAVTALDGLGLFPRALTAEIIAAFHALDDGEVKRIAVESPSKRRGSGTEYDRVALWLAGEAMVLRAFVPAATSENAAIALLTGVTRSREIAPPGPDWRFAPMPGVSHGFIRTLFRTGAILLDAKAGAARRDVEAVISAQKSGEPWPADGFALLAQDMRKIFADRRGRTTWLRLISATGGRKRRIDTAPDAPLPQD